MLENTRKTGGGWLHPARVVGKKNRWDGRKKVLWGGEKLG